MTSTDRPLAEDERRALRAAARDWVPTDKDVWQPMPYHVEGVQKAAEEAVLAGIAAAAGDRSPLGLVIQGDNGAGKTHLLGWVRDQILHQGGYFLYADFSSGRPFWEQVLRSVRKDLNRTVDGADTQLTLMLRRLCAVAGADSALTDAITGRTALKPEDLVRFEGVLRTRYRGAVQECRDTLRALVCHACADDVDAQDAAAAYLAHREPGEPPLEAPSWRLRQRTIDDQRLVEEICELLALTGPSVLAIDQVDNLLAQAHKALLAGGESPEQRAQDALVEGVAGGWMALWQQSRRTLCLLACFESSWDLVKRRALASVPDRFRSPIMLQTIADPALAEAIAIQRFTAPYAATGFAPPYPTWPIAPAAFGTAPGMTPRTLLQRIDEHVQQCLAGDLVRELERFDVVVEPAAPVAAAPEPAGGYGALDERFASLVRAAEVTAALDPAREDAVMPDLLAAGLRAWIIEQGAAGHRFTCETGTGRNPDLHARLRQEVDAATESEVHWAFRAIGAVHHRRYQKQLTEAMSAAGVDGPLPRHLVVLRNAEWSSGAATRDLLARLRGAGGQDLGVDGGDLAVFAALKDLLAEGDPATQGWLEVRRPASGTTLLSRVLGEVAAVPEPSVPEQVSSGMSEPESLVVGRRLRDGQPVPVALRTFTYHVAMFAGSGSGKTVKLRRIVEEAALAGVSSIVLDLNNDLARLGDRWPEPPPGWTDEDARLAEEYHATTDVVIWTPNRQGGNPLSFQPLPDLTELLREKEIDAYRDALNHAVESLVARVPGGPAARARKEAVLREALDHLTRRGGHGIDAFVELLADLPLGATRVAGGEAIAAELADALTIAQINDPMFGGAGVTADPGVLLEPAPGKRARVSVISFVGLSSNAQQQGFVHQLQTNLFAWVKRNPYRDRPLGGLLVMDEARTLAPSRGSAVSKESTISLFAQARKYGLGLVVATQAPKDLDNRIAGNCTTQFYGRLNSPAQIEAAKEMASAKGGDVSRIGLLGSGEFYVTSQGIRFQQVRTPMCLSYHPDGPLTAEEVMERARVR